jgi:hypothetical protein
MTPDTLASIGRALYGARWQSDLARALGVRIDSLQHAAAGRRPIPEGWAAECRALLEARAAEIGALLAA